MTVVNATTGEIVLDLFLVMGLSLALWFCYHVLCLLIPTNNIFVSLPLHLIFFSAAGFVSFCFIVGRTASQQPRWHMAVGFALGAFAYYGFFARYVRGAQALMGRLLRLAARPVVRLGRWIYRAVIARAAAGLQKMATRVYNKRKERAQARRTRRKKHAAQDDGKEQQKKEPIRAYAET